MGILDNVWNYLTRSKNRKINESTGSIYPINVNNRFRKDLNLEIPFEPIRPILNSHSAARELIEFSTYSYEMRHAVSKISSDVFQSLNGEIKSWMISDVYEDKKINKEVYEIGKSIANRKNGKQFLLGGNFLQLSVRNMLNYGDAFISLGFDKDDNGNYYLSKSIHLPPLSMFVDMTEDGSVNEYIQKERLYGGQNDIHIHPLKVLQFSYEQNEIYGMPLGYQSLPAWRELKNVVASLEQAARDTGYSLLHHILPPGASEMDRRSYIEDYENMLNDGIVTNLFSLEGTQIERISAESNCLKPLMDLYLQKRYACIPPGVPLWFYPGFGLESSAGKDISNQPAMAYARMISGIRSILGEQIKYAIGIEIILKKGYEFYKANENFDIVWGDWYVSGMEQGMLNQGDDNQKPTSNDNKNDKK